MKDNEHIKRLLLQIKLHNSHDAYKELFLLMHQPLCQFAFSILKSRDDSREVVSDVFISIWEKRDRLDSIDAPLFYLYTMVKNMSLNSLKRQKRQAILDSGDWLVPLNSIYFDPEKLMMTEEVMNRVRKAVQDLPDRCRLIFQLVKEDGLKYKETAELLQISVKTVEAQMAIALRRLAKCMQLTIAPPRKKIVSEK